MLNTSGRSGTGVCETARVAATSARRKPTVLHSTPISAPEPAPPTMIRAILGREIRNMSEDGKTPGMPSTALVNR
nr:hypothetical protein BJQ95_02604 [Cryobacterium sp. SO1]